MLLPVAVQKPAAHWFVEPVGIEALPKGQKYPTGQSGVTGAAPKPAMQ